jgi:osmotically-inducible protein OsmY
MSVDAFVTTFAPVSKYRFGATVHTADGELGSLAYVVVDTASRAVTAIGVKLGLFGGEHLMPVGQVIEATPEDIRLALTREQVEQIKEKPAGPGLTILKGGTTVTLNGKRLGRLTQLTTNRETQVLRHLVVDRLGGEVLVSGRAITGIEGQLIAVALPGVRPDQLMPYRADDELHEEIREAIEEIPQLRVDLPGMDIRALDGVVWLRGHVASDLARRYMEERVQGIRGIDELHNELISDSQLAAAVSAALARDTRTLSEYGIGVYPRLGEVFLRGRVRSEAAREAAAQIARVVPGVKGLHNELGIDPSIEGIPEMAGVTNTEDLVPGGR